MLELLPDVPAGKLVLAELPSANDEDLLALERAGVDAILVPVGKLLVAGLSGGPAGLPPLPCLSVR